MRFLFKKSLYLQTHRQSYTIEFVMNTKRRLIWWKQQQSKSYVNPISRAFLTLALDFEEHCSSECRTQPLHSRNKRTCLRKRADSLWTQIGWDIGWKSWNSMFSYFILIARLFFLTGNLPCFIRWLAFGGKPFVGSHNLSLTSATLGITFSFLPQKERKALKQN